MLIVNVAVVVANKWVFVSSCVTVIVLSPAFKIVTVEPEMVAIEISEEV